MNATIKDEFTKVQRVVDGKYNYIDKNGKIVSKKTITLKTKRNENTKTKNN